MRNAASILIHICLTKHKTWNQSAAKITTNMWCLCCHRQESSVATSEWSSSRIAINEVTKVSTCPDIAHLAAGGRAWRKIGYVIKGKAERGSVWRLVHQHDSHLQKRSDENRDAKKNRRQGKLKVTNGFRDHVIEKKLRSKLYR